MKPAHRLYALLLITSIGITALAALPHGTFWTTVLLSIGCGGIASVGVTWLLSIRDFRALKKENAYKFACILEQYVYLFKRLLFVAANECHGLCHDQTERPFRDWLTMLCDEKNDHGTSKSDTDMARRCERLSGTIEEIQKFIERFQAQSASLILSGYPNIDEILRTIVALKILKSFFGAQRLLWDKTTQENLPSLKRFVFFLQLHKNLNTQIMCHPLRVWDFP